MRSWRAVGSFACHSTVLGPDNLLVSSDLAGYVARALEKEWGVYPVIMIGAAGDVSNRLYRQGNDLKELNRVGSEMMEPGDLPRRRPQELQTSRSRRSGPSGTEDTYYPGQGPQTAGPVRRDRGRRSRAATHL